MQITVGKWKTRGGNIAEILYTVTYDPDAVLDGQRLIQGKISGELHTWYADGSYYSGSVDPNDLIEPYIEPEIQPGYGLNSDPAKDEEKLPVIGRDRTGPTDEEYDDALDRDVRRPIAIKAMSALLRARLSVVDMGKLAEDSYDIADAMMEEEESRYGK